MTPWRQFQRALASTLLVGLLCFGLFGAADVAHAQTPFTTPTPGQRDLARQAGRLMKAERYDEVVRLLEASLALGELNITWLNLGRVYHKMGLCEEAVRAYDEVLSAPMVRRPGPEDVAGALSRFRRDLEDTCQGTLEVSCSPSDAVLTIDQGEPVACNAGPFPLAPGRHRVVAVSGKRRSADYIMIQRGRTTRLSLDLGDTLPEIVPPGGEDASGEGLQGGWWIGIGGASLGVGLALDLLPDSSGDFELEAIDFVPVALYAAGLVAVIYGLVELGGESPQEE